MIRKFNFPPKLLQLVEYLHGTLGFGGSGEVDVPTLRKLCAEMESEHDAAQRSPAMTQVTNEMVEAARLVMTDMRRDPTVKERLRAALEAALVVYMVERAELIAALRPFAEESNRPEWSNEHPDTLIASYTDLYLRDFERARACLERLGAAIAKAAGAAKEEE